MAQNTDSKAQFYRPRNPIEKILKHCDLWKDKVPRRPSPEEDLRAAATTEEPYYDYTFLKPA
jgi:hypothetical protein